MFSIREGMILKVLGKKTMTVEQITDKLFEGDKAKPFDANISVGNTIRRIIEKCEYNKLPWTLHRERKEEQGSKYFITRVNK